ncbi:MAG: DMT family transporter [Proteobacteria bacterium]|nr:DMT family transporter [Pseudomonadota bacterium]
MSRLSAIFAAASGNAKGIAWMFLTGLIFVGVTGVVRHLGSNMHPIQLAFLRYAIALIFLSPILWREFRGHRNRPRPYGLHAARGLLHAFGVMLWFYAMAHIPVAEVTALGFTAPIFATIGAALFLGEKLYLRRISAVLIAFAGAMVILRPGLQVIELGAIAQLVAAPFFAASLLIGKKLTETEHNGTIVAVMGVCVTLTLFPPAMYFWRTPTGEEVIWLFAVAGLATVGHLTMTQAFRCAEVTALQPITFLQLVWATILGFYVFAEEPDLWTWVGGGIIVISATYIAHREARARKRATTEVRP